MATSTISNPDKIIECTITINDGFSGSGKLIVCGRIATLSLVVNCHHAGIDLGVAWIPGQSSGVYAKYLPNEDRWLSCDFYMNNVTASAEANIDTNGVIKVNTPISGRDLKITGSWVTKG